MAREAGIPTDYLRALMQAAGRANPRRGERVFSDEDVELAQLVKAMLDAGLPREEVLEVARVLSQGMAQSAEAVRSMVGNAFLRPGDSEATVGLRYIQAFDALAPLVPTLLTQMFRAHLRDSIRRALVTEAEREAGALAGTRNVGLAFADLVGYTRLGERLAAEDVGRIAARFAELAARSQRGSTLLVKTIGDAAMFVSPTVPGLVATLVALRKAVDDADPELPSIRAGIAYGPATTRAGDWFGSTVNLASRVTAAAKPGQVLAVEAVATRAPAATWKRRRRRSFKGVEGRMRTFSLERYDEE